MAKKDDNPTDKINIYIQDIRNFHNSIKDTSILKELSKIEETMRKIQTWLKDETNTAKKAKSINQFLEYYMPNVLKILNNYKNIEIYSPVSENAAETKKQIFDILPAINKVFEKEFDNMFNEINIDISTDVKMLKDMMALDGYDDKFNIKTEKQNTLTTINYPNGDKYIGEVKDGKRNGQGTLTSADGDKYIGEWKDDKMNGQGIATAIDGEKYIGEWKDDLWHGQGTHIWVNGDKYVGEFKNDEQNGQGTYTWANGNKYVGEWKDGKKNGQGTCIWVKGDKYVGEFKDDKKNGQGTYTWANGDKYVGEAKDDKQSGQGTYTYANGDKYVGEWKDGQRIVNGTKIIEVPSHFNAIDKEIYIKIMSGEMSLSEAAEYYNRYMEKDKIGTDGK